jgi:HTH-type transcriptional regulator/antitoxin MqsA
LITSLRGGRIFGGVKNGFSHYERGETKPLPAVSNLLKMLEQHPEDLNYLIDKIIWLHSFIMK